MNTRYTKIALLLLLSTPIYAQQGAYLNMEAGVVDISDGSFSSEGMYYGPAGRISFGHLWGQSQMNYGLEAGLTYFTNTYENDYLLSRYAGTLTYNGHIFDLYGVLKYTFLQNFILTGKVGAGYLYERAVVRGTTTYGQQVSLSFEGNRLTPAIGFGFGYQVTPRLEISLMFNKYITRYNQTENPVDATSSTLLGLAYRF